jgi:hypothetical protein
VLVIQQAEPPQTVQGMTTFIGMGIAVFVIYYHITNYPNHFAA